MNWIRVTEGAHTVLLDLEELEEAELDRCAGVTRSLRPGARVDEGGDTRHGFAGSRTGLRKIGHKRALKKSRIDGSF